MADIKLIERDSDIDMKNAKKLDWDVYSNGSYYDVWLIPGCVHSIGGRWGENCYWACPRDMVPRYGNLFEFNGEPCCFGITAKEINHHKNKWDEHSLERSIECTITRNDEEFYSFYCRDMSYALAKAQLLLTERILEGPVNFIKKNYVSDIVGRKIYYRGIPAKITNYCDGQACVIVERDDGKERGFPVPEYFEHEGEVDTEMYVIPKIDLMETNDIWWFRDYIFPRDAKGTKK